METSDRIDIVGKSTKMSRPGDSRTFFVAEPLTEQEITEIRRLLNGKNNKKRYKVGQVVTVVTVTCEKT